MYKGDLLRLATQELPPAEAEQLGGMLIHRKFCQGGFVQVSMVGEDVTGLTVVLETSLGVVGFGNQAFCQMSRSVGP